MKYIERYNSINTSDKNLATTGLAHYTTMAVSLHISNVWLTRIPSQVMIEGISEKVFNKASTRVKFQLCLRYIAIRCVPFEPTLDITYRRPY